MFVSDVQLVILSHFFQGGARDFFVVNSMFSFIPYPTASILRSNILALSNSFVSSIYFLNLDLFCKINK